MKVGKTVVLAAFLAASLSAFAEGGGTIGSGTRAADDGGGTIGSGTLTSEDDGGLVGSGGGKEADRGGLIGSGTRSGLMGSGSYFGSGLAIVTDAFGDMYLVISDGVSVFVQALD
jgi:hypothetical protein